TFPPIEVRPEQGKGLPVSKPEAIISLFFSPKGSHNGGTSSRIIIVYFSF
ncbi:unnamed protein product, partial [marine sediment metagenome]